MGRQGSFGNERRQLTWNCSSGKHLVSFAYPKFPFDDLTVHERTLALLVIILTGTIM